MSSARNNILKRLNSATPSRTSDRSSTTISTGKQDLIKTFEARLKENAANVTYSSIDTIGDCLDDILAANQLGNTIISNLEISFRNSNLDIIKGRATGEESIGLSQAVCGISDTGTLVLNASSENPTTINFLVDHHFVIINENDVIESLYDAMATLKEKELIRSRAINFVSGPSRTADIEQTIQLGAHGPRNLWVLIIKN